MNQMDRRGFLKLAGTGSALAAAAAVLPVVGSFAGQPSPVLRFSSAVGLPQHPLPAYATQLVEGVIDLEKGTGLVTSRVLAGHPEANSDIGLPGLARMIRISGVTREGSRVRMHGLIEDRSQLRPGESPQVEIVVDQPRGIVRAPFLGREVVLQLT